MKNTKTKILLTLLLTVIGLPLMFFASMEFYTWKSHGYVSNYKERQKCLEVSPLSPEERERCNQLKKAYDQSKR